MSGCPALSDASMHRPGPAWKRLTLVSMPSVQEGEGVEGKVCSSLLSSMQQAQAALGELEPAGAHQK